MIRPPEPNFRVGLAVDRAYRHFGSSSRPDTVIADSFSCISPTTKPNLSNSIPTLDPGLTWLEFRFRLRDNSEAYQGGFFTGNNWTAQLLTKEVQNYQIKLAGFSFFVLLLFFLLDPVPLHSIQRSGGAPGSSGSLWASG